MSHSSAPDPLSVKAQEALRRLAKAEAIDMWEVIRLDELWDGLTAYLTKAYEMGFSDGKALTKRPKRRKL